MAFYIATTGISTILSWIIVLQAKFLNFLLKLEVKAMFFLTVRVHQKHVMKGGRLEKICFVSTLLKIAPSIKRISKNTVKGFKGKKVLTVSEHVNMLLCKSKWKITNTLHSYFQFKIARKLGLDYFTVPSMSPNCPFWR